MTNRGTAYILYSDVADAEAAIAHMHEAQLDGASFRGRHHQHAEVDQRLTVSMVVVIPQAHIGVDHHPAFMEAIPQDDTALHHHQGARHLQDDTAIDRALAIETSILTGPAHIRGQDPGPRDQDRSHRGRVVVLHHAVVVDTGVGNCRHLQAEEGGEGVRAIQAIPATVIEAVAGVETEAGIGANASKLVRIGIS
ncbi:MAG: hypothetical protein Q9188_005293 [Gyalolechia gomerana]